MDPVTHGIAGALIGKAFFANRFSSASQPSLTKSFSPKARVAIFATTLGAVFPDVDVFVDAFTRDPLAIARYHRGFTHSFIGLPIFAVALAWLTRAFFRWYAKRPSRKEWAPPSFAFLFAIYAAGIASHIILDGFTSFGTRMLNPFSKDRVAWDLLFIIDFVFTALILVPQLAVWVHQRREAAKTRAATMWGFLTVLTLAAWALARAADFPFSLRAVIIASAIFAALFFLPIWRGVGARISRAQWCRAGFAVSCAYIAACGFAHHAAMSRVRAFASNHHIAAEKIGAVPLPPSLLDWNGLILTRGGVYQSSFSLRNSGAPEFEFWDDSPPNRFIQEAKKLEPVRTYLWYARFPVTNFIAADGKYLVRYADLRFFSGAGHAMPFTFYVSFNSEGKMLEYGWIERGPQFPRSSVPSDNEP
ncbi:MAG: metal-dependent hydrolase [Candidatus Acidiferrales bacterium]